MPRKIKSGDIIEYNSYGNRKRQVVRWEYGTYWLDDEYFREGVCLAYEALYLYNGKFVDSLSTVTN